MSMRNKLTFIRNGEWTVSNEVPQNRHFLAVVGVLTNRFEIRHVQAHVGVDAFKIELKYVSCFPLGYKQQVLLDCAYGGRSQGEHTQLWLRVAPLFFPGATYICKMDIDTLLLPSRLHTILRSLFPPAVYGHSCWVDPCLWGVKPASATMRCMHNRIWKSCDAVSHMFCGVCGGFYALSYDVAFRISPMTNNASLHAKFGDYEDQYTSHLIHRAYGGDFSFASDWRHWQAYPNYNLTTAAVIHNIKTRRQWKDVLKPGPWEHRRLANPRVRQASDSRPSP